MRWFVAEFWQLDVEELLQDKSIRSDNSLKIEGASIMQKQLMEVKGIRFILRITSGGRDLWRGSHSEFPLINGNALPLPRDPIVWTKDMKSEDLKILGSTTSMQYAGHRSSELHTCWIASDIKRFDFNECKKSPQLRIRSLSNRSRRIGLM